MNKLPGGGGGLPHNQPRRLRRHHLRRRLLPGRCAGWLRWQGHSLRSRLGGGRGSALRSAARRAVAAGPLDLGAATLE